MKKILVVAMAILGLALVPSGIVLAETVDRTSTDFTDIVKDESWFDACAAGRNFTSQACKPYREFCLKYYDKAYDECARYNERYDSTGRAKKNSNNDDSNSGESATTDGSTGTNYQPGSADCNQQGDVETSILGGGGCINVGDKGQGIFSILTVVLNVLTVGVGILAMIGFVIAGIQYLTAKDNDGQIAKAKMRMLQIVIGLFVFATMWAILNWILPGGVFGNGGNAPTN